MYLTIVATTTENRIAIYQDFQKRGAAEEHLSRVIEKYPDAFVAEQPTQGGFADWRVSGKTVGYDPLPAPPQPSPGAAAVARVQADEALNRIVRAMAGRLGAPVSEILNDIGRD